MKIAVIGTGRIGGRLARAWTAAGHTVVVGTRDPQADKSQALGREAGVEVQAIEAAAAAADVVVLAVPFAALETVLPAIAPLVGGKIVIDTTNAIVRPTPAPGAPLIPALRFPPSTSAAEDAAAKLPGARLVKSFNAQGAEIIDDPVFGGERASNFYCGDDEEARRVAASLIADIGFDPVDLGPLRSARQLEMLTLLWFEATAATGSREIAFRLLRR